MGLFKNIKNILFEEEEPTEQIKITPEMRNEESPSKEEKVVNKPQEVPVKVVKPEPKVEIEPQSERELFKTSNSFPFFNLDDEDEPVKQEPVKKPEPVIPQRNTNVMEYERKKKIERRYEHGRIEKTEITETIERKKFKPSPIISPVYGILNQDYEKNDIVKRNGNEKIDIQSVRDKAFGDKKENIENTKPIELYYEETKTVTISKPEEHEKKVKTIDELLEDTSDIVVNLDDNLENDIEQLMPERKISKKSEIDDYDDIVLPSDLPKDATQEIKIPDVEDTLENDLFDLIDSMYNTKEDE